MHYWLSPYGDITDYGGFSGVSLPAGWLGAIDLRSYAQCAAGRPGEGFALIAMPDDARVDAAAIDLGTDLNEALAPRDRTTIGDALGLPVALSATTPAGILYEVTALQADPTGDDRTKPFQPKPNGRFMLKLAGEVVVDRQYDFNGPEAVAWQEMLRLQYREKRQDSLDEKSPPDHFRKVLGGLMEKYDLPREYFQPEDLRNDTELKPETTISDNFNRANENPVNTNGLWSWGMEDGAVQVLSNQLRDTATVTSRARAETDLSSDDHYAQITQVFTPAGPDYLCPMGRFAAADNTGYILVSRHTDFSSGLFKVVSGSYTAVNTFAGDNSAGQVLKIECDGSTITGYRGGVLIDDGSDGTITGNLRTGIELVTTGSAVTGDDFSASDLAAPPATAHNLTLLGVGT